MSGFSEQDLKRVLREGAGADESIDLDGEITDTTFAELGYDSLALLETTSRIEREYGIQLDDDAITGESTPRDVVQLISDQLSATRPG